MIDAREAQQLTQAGYRPIRPVIPGAQRTLLAVREADARPVVVRRVSAGEVNITALAAPSRHGLELIEVLSCEESVFLVEEYAERGPLSTLLARRQLSAGMAVTALVPLLEQLCDLAVAGWLPVSLHLTDLLVDGEGKVRLASTVVWQQRVASGWVATVAESERIVRELVAEIGAVIPGLSAQLAHTERCGPAEWNALTEWLQQHTSPEPLAVPDALTVHALPQRIGSPEPAHVASEDGPKQLVSVLTAQFSTRRAALVSRGQELLSRLSGRRRIVLLAGGICALLTTVLLLLPSEPERSAAQSSNTAQPTSSQMPQVVPSEVSAAANALLSARSACQTAAPACVDGIDAVDSAAYAEDQERLAAGLALRAAGIPVETPTAVSTMGQAVLLSFRTETATASVLLMQTEAGWRIREVFD